MRRGHQEPRLRGQTAWLVLLPRHRVTLRNYLTIRYTHVLVCRVRIIIPTVVSYED